MGERFASKTQYYYKMSVKNIFTWTECKRAEFVKGLVEDLLLFHQWHTKHSIPFSVFCCLLLVIKLFGILNVFFL